jgi:hypothetical protein
MDIFLRIVAIIIEVLILGVIAYAVLNGAKLTIFDLGVRAKYGRVVSMALIVVGIILLIFFIAHLTTFYPAI